ncbi:nucleotidyltransferase family protein [Ruixingdingia sedimenti]|uniref:Nucleotidyltransferase family protein n=1 Tax=Ruixingdingia sedimenti TaxID=3073604 RepID=A0ABU1F326_9RHOB|nr:nucleotidyltransferase family protein [Xinfangfangia sp. LG-4]MDR5651274.1 nucleotidyltransferase family protein [Xinfangfangia sp. LG-4]
MAAGLAVLIPAAGASARMRGGDKLMEVVEGAPLIARMARRALAAGLPVLVTLPPGRPARAAALAGIAVETLVVADAAEGLSASIRAGIAALAPRAAAVMVLLADLPDITTEDLAQMAAAHAAAPDAILRGAAADGTPGHPVIFPARLFPALRALTGDAGARDLLRALGPEVRPVPLPGRHAVTDLDTPEDWARWRGGPRP